MRHVPRAAQRLFSQIGIGRASMAGMSRRRIAGTIAIGVLLLPLLLGVMR